MPAHYFKGVIIARTPQTDDSNQVENPPSRLSLLLSIPITGCDLFNLGFKLAFGLWRVGQFGPDGLAIITKVQLILMMTSSLVYAFHFFRVGERPGFSG